MLASKSKQEDLKFLVDMLEAVEFCGKKYAETGNEFWKEAALSWHSVVEVHKKQMEATDYEKMDKMWLRITGKVIPNSTG